MTGCVDRVSSARAPPSRHVTCDALWATSEGAAEIPSVTHVSGEDIRDRSLLVSETRLAPGTTFFAAAKSQQWVVHITKKQMIS